MCPFKDVVGKESSSKTYTKSGDGVVGDLADRMGLNPGERNGILDFTELFNDFVSQQTQHEVFSCAS